MRLASTAAPPLMASTNRHPTLRGGPNGTNQPHRQSRSRLLRGGSYFARRVSTDPRQLLAIVAGGALGALARAGAVELWPPQAGRWPWATFLVNVLGALLLGYFATRLQERLPLSAYRRPLLGTGLCGALTTFSTMQVELLRMFDHDRPGLAVLYAGVSIAAGLLAVTVATSMVRRARVVR